MSFARWVDAAFVPGTDTAGASGPMTFCSSFNSAAWSLRPMPDTGATAGFICASCGAGAVGATTGFADHLAE